MSGVDSSSAASSASAYPHASDQTIVGYILIALVIFAAMALIFRSLFKLVKAARRLDKADLKSAAAVAASEGEVSTSSTSADAGVGNHNTQHLTHRLKSAIPRRWDDIDDKLDEFERLTVKYYGNAKRYAVRMLQNMGVLEKAADEEGGIAPDSHSKAKAKAKWRLTAGYFNKTGSSSSQHQDQQQQPEDPANTTTDSDLELDLEDTSIIKLPSLDLSSTPTLPYQPHPSKEHPTTPTHKEVRRITAIDILEALAKVGRLSLSLSSYTNSTYTEKMDSLLPRVSRDSKASLASTLERGNTNAKGNKEWRRLTALDYLSKFVTSAVPTDRNKPLPHRPISVVGSVHSGVSVEDVVIGPPPPLALAVISEEDLEGGGTYETSACEDDDGKQADSETEKDASALPVPVTRAPSTHRRSMTLPLQQALPHLNLASGLPSSSSLSSSSKTGEKLILQLQLQAEKDGQVVSESDENTTTTEDSELRPTSDIPHITALAELAASIVGEHPDAPPILERVASLSLTTPLASPLPYSLPLFVDTTSLSLSLDPTSTPLQNQNYNHQAAPSKFAWASNTHRTTFGLITRANVPPTPPRLAMFIGVGDGGDVGFRSNAGSVVGVGGKKSLGADTGIVLVQKIKEAVNESQNEGQSGKGGQAESEGQLEEDQLRKEGQVEKQEGLLAKDGPAFLMSRFRKSSKKPRKALRSLSLMLSRW
ncbi:uncharacterized protein LACBIDRAFT_314917 [Laccaria bicolor S238N-H82]|uniref:Predicted protein n=1 Tax=Laccaria bicolor (strain S238N-H82 / ATCC MYA-4686) TaxID=486041 RepID=B0DZG0_LACBS|nr:uncharacterized protein LACBIDRAFT_314917 [Laccaria bicolor S238N-H82]EDR00009.1 predicted protein [Laccaria bicolor S238N-H82]|eukprot:XP_001889318.1 predicted protein [Laccaria bicolor S238N-H82]